MEHAVRTGVGAALSLGAARLLGMPEAFWAPVTTLIVLQSTLGAAWDISKARLIGNVLGAASGGVVLTYLGTNMIVLGPMIFVFGLICSLLHLGQPAYRFAGITYAIITLTVRASAPWVIAVHRFIEVSLGIVVALLLVAVWPETEVTSGKNPREKRS
jgi:uncharacterized membrane protein YgaE (UPF0421/DUF939 family)